MTLIALDGDTHHALVDDMVCTCEFCGSALQSPASTKSITGLESCFGSSLSYFITQQAGTRSPLASTVLAPLAKAVLSDTGHFILQSVDTRIPVVPWT